MSSEISKQHVYVDDITYGLETVKISFLNEKNFQQISKSVTYISRNILTSETLAEDFESIPLPCNCVEVCDHNCSCGFGSKIAFQNGTLLEDFVTGITKPIIECSFMCSCNNACSNRVIQKGITIPLQVFLTEYKGFGVRTLQFIPKLTFVCEYAGELIDKLEAETRMKSRLAEEPNYVYVLKEHGLKYSNICTIIDPTKFGNVGRYLNHSCSPNLIPIPVRASSMLPRICFFANRNISPYEELTYNYGVDICEEDDTNISDDSSHSYILKKCYCKSLECCGVLPFDTKCLS